VLEVTAETITITAAVEEEGPALQVLHLEPVALLEAVPAEALRLLRVVGLSSR